MKLTEDVTEKVSNTKIELILSCFLLVTMALVISPVGQGSKLFKWNSIENCKKNSLSVKLLFYNYQNTK